MPTAEVRFESHPRLTLKPSTLPLENILTRWRGAFEVCAEHMKEFHSISASRRPPRQGAIDSGKATKAIQTDLGTVGSEAAGPNLTILQPPLKARVTASGVELEWSWSGFSEDLDALLIQVDRGDTQGWRLLVHDTTPGYKDTTPPPAALARWSYRAIYIKDDVQVGLWSNVVSVTVPG